VEHFILLPFRGRRLAKEASDAPAQILPVKYSTICSVSVSVCMYACLCEIADSKLGGYTISLLNKNFMFP